MVLPLPTLEGLTLFGPFHLLGVRWVDGFGPFPFPNFARAGPRWWVPGFFFGLSLIYFAGNGNLGKGLFFPDLGKGAPF